jgi:hypothetical protein
MAGHGETLESLWPVFTPCHTPMILDQLPNIQVRFQKLRVAASQSETKLETEGKSEQGHQPGRGPPLGQGHLPGHGPDRRPAAVSRRTIHKSSH